MQAPVDNRKERDRDRERERDRDRESKDREKRISRELSPLDHRGDVVGDIEKKSNRRSVTRELSSNGGKSESRSPCLAGVIYPLISEVSFIKT